MVELGTFDADVEESACQAYLQNAKQLMLGADILPNFKTQLRGEGEWRRLTPVSGEPMKVVDIQRFLTASGFFPYGKADGICGYRTTAAIRLFQEYVRTHGAADFTPDGKWGPKCAAQARAWQDAGTRADWTQWSSASPGPECAAWLALLGQVKDRSLANPSPMLKLVNAHVGATDTVKVGDWDFDPKKIHFIGIRRRETVAKAAQTFDDLFVLLVHGLVFKFFGSTEPGVLARGASAYPFLVNGQHRYRFGWHKQSEGAKIFQALKPASSGVLVVRSKDLALTDADLPARAECNSSINVHWGPDPTWSAGCQVMQGQAYVDPEGRKRDCSAFAASGYAALGTRRNGVVQTKGAYTLLSDLVSALSGATPGDNTVHYMLISDQDLALDPAVAQKARDALAEFGSA
jgi:hypothetical protein